MTFQRVTSNEWICNMSRATSKKLRPCFTIVTEGLNRWLSEKDQLFENEESCVLQENKFPNLVKKVEITLASKKFDNTSKDNYCPTRTISSFTKFFESFLFIQLNNKNNWILENLVKYRSSHPEVLLVKGVLKICSKFLKSHFGMDVLL